jgi:hypothetical protein
VSGLMNMFSMGPLPPLMSAREVSWLASFLLV